MYQPAPGFFEFVEENIGVDPVRLRLRYHGKGEPWVDDAITHIECVRKSKGKFGDAIPELMLSPLSVEQATSAVVAAFHGSLVREFCPGASTLLDMTCGLGVDFRAVADAMDASVRRCVGIDMDARCSGVAQYNFRKMAGVTIKNADSVEWLKEYNGSRFDIIFIDPARRDGAGGKVFNLYDCRPVLPEIMPLIASKAKYMIAKLSPMLDVTQTLRDLPLTTRLYVVEEKGECRELLAVSDFSCTDSERGYNGDNVEIIVTDCERSYLFTLAEESASDISLGEPESGMWLFEPSPAMMKAAPFATLCSRDGLKKLHQNSHLYVAPQPVGGLLGRWNRIAKVIEFSSKNAKSLAASVVSADIAVRNFPIRADEFQRRFRFKNGGAWRVMATTISGCRGHVLLLLEK